MKNLFAISTIVLVLAGCGGGGGGGDNDCSVVYEVTGTSARQKVSLTISPTSSAGGRPIQNSMPVYPTPWREIWNYDNGAFIYISAQNTIDSPSAYTLNVTVNGKLVKSSQMTGYTVTSYSATCNR